MTDECRTAKPQPAIARVAPAAGEFTFVTNDEETISLICTYADRLDLSDATCLVTTCRKQFGVWLGRSVAAAYGGAYAYDRASARHLVLINLERIDRTQPRALEIVVCEELLHMRDRLDGDRRRHAKHGYDRIAHRVAALVGVSLEDVRGCLLPVATRPYRYVCRCPSCNWEVLRKKRGRWACPRCWQKRGRMESLEFHDIGEVTTGAIARMGDVARGSGRIG